MPRLLLLLLGYFPIVGTLVVSLTAFGTYVHVRETLTSPMFERLDRANELKEDQLRRWFADERDQVLAQAQSADFAAAAREVVDARGQRGAEDAYERLTALIEESELTTNSNPVVSILTTGGIIVFSTSDSREGQYQALQNTSTYFTAERADRLEPNFYRSPLSGELMLTLATPIEDNEGNRFGALAVDLDLQALDQLIRASLDSDDPTEAYLGNTGETYLVAKTSIVENNFIAANPDPESAAVYSGGIDSRGISDAINGLSATDLYLNYDRVPVLGAYQWVNGINLALLAETQQSEAFLPAQIAARRVFLVGMSGVIIVALVLLLMREKVPGKLTTVS